MQWRRIARLLAACVAALSASAASAHAALVASDPGDGAVLASAPSNLRLRFDEPVTPLALTLIVPDGSTRALAGAVRGDGELTVPVPASASLPGTFLLSWRVVSVDGHPVGGALTYSVGAPSDVPNTDLTAAIAPTLVPAIWTTRFVLSVAMFAAVGAAFFAAFMPGASAMSIRRGSRVAVAVAVIALLCAVALQGLDALAAPWVALGRWATWHASLATSYGATAALLLLALLSVVLATQAHAPRARKLAAVAALLLLGGALASSGHASAAPPRWLARPAVFVHAIAVALWIGSLWPLLRALHAPQGPRAIAIFSRVAPWVVLALIASGATLAFLQLDLSRAVWSSAYGRVLLAKLAVVVVLLAIAAINRFRLTTPAVRGDARATARLGALMRAEIVLAVIVLALVATWRFTPPPRALALQAPRAQHVALRYGAAIADATLSTDSRGQRLTCVSLPHAVPPTADPAQVTLVWSRPALAVEPWRRAATRHGNGVWCAERFVPPLPGRWHLTAEVLVSDFEQQRFDGDVDVGAP